jgi:glycosyltransferase involved in cell wall biosynthesis
MFIDLSCPDPHVTLRSRQIGEPRVIANILRHVEPRYGGIAASVTALCQCSRDNHDFRERILAFCGSESPEQQVPVYRFPSGARGCARLAGRSVFAEQLRNSSVVHIHGLWEEHFLYGMIGSYLYRKPVIISPHGMLDSWALRQKRLKKWLFSTVIQKPVLTSACVMRALTASEAADIRSYGVKAPVVVIPNGVTRPGRAEPESFFECFPHTRGAKIATFIGRLTQKKGLDILWRAWVTAARRVPDAQLVIAGPDCEGVGTELRKLIAKSELRNRVTMPGMVTGELKWALLSASTVFVLPSRSEGFSVAALEALSVGTPAIVSHECNLPEIGPANCGWSIENTEQALADALIDALSMPLGKILEMRTQATVLARTKYNWTRAGHAIREVYEWMLGGPPPIAAEVYP